MFNIRDCEILAKLDGWKFVDNDENYHPYWVSDKHSRTIDSNLSSKIFLEYLDNMNAIHEIEQSLTNKEKLRYLYFLWLETSLISLHGIHADKNSTQHLVFAKKEHRIKALLKIAQERTNET